MGKKRTTTKNEPWAPAQPYILQGMQQTQRVFDQQQPNLDKFSGMAFDTYGKLNPGAVSGIQASQGLVNDTIGGRFLSGGNPYLNDMVDRARRNVLNDVKGSFSAAGRYGSNAFADTAADAMASAELGLRFDNYNRERQNQINAVGQAQDLMRGNQATLDQAAALPWTGVGAQVGNIRQASQGYGTTTTTQRDGSGLAAGLGALGTLGGAAISTFGPAIMASDPRIKKNVEPVGQTPEGLGVYNYDNMLTGQREQGVMADEVAAKKPEALGPTVGGIATVNYNEVGVQPKAIPDEQLKPKPKGLLGLLNAAVNPDVNTLGGSLTALGQSVMAQAGGVGGAIGRGLMGVQLERDRRDELQHQRALDIRRADILEQQATLGNRARIVQRRDGSVVAIDPITLQDTEISGPIQSAQPLVRVYDPKSPTGERYAPRDQAVGAPAGEPPRAPAATSAAPARARFSTFRVGQAVGGYTYMGGDPNDPKSWRR